MGHYVKIEKNNIAHAGQHDQRLYVITSAPEDKYGRKLCATRWEDSRRWEMSYEFVGDDWTGVDEHIAAEVTGKGFMVKHMIDEA